MAPMVMGSTIPVTPTLISPFVPPKPAGTPTNEVQTFDLGGSTEGTITLGSVEGGTPVVVDIASLIAGGSAYLQGLYDISYYAGNTSISGSGSGPYTITWQDTYADFPMFATYANNMILSTSGVNGFTELCCHEFGYSGGGR